MKDYKLADFGRRWYLIAAVATATFFVLMLVLQAYVRTAGNNLFFDLNSGHSPIHFVVNGHEFTEPPAPAVLSSQNQKLRESGTTLFNLIVFKYILDGLPFALIPGLVTAIWGYGMDQMILRMRNRAKA
jgi:hypothetical protein